MEQQQQLAEKEISRLKESLEEHKVMLFNAKTDSRNILHQERAKFDAQTANIQAETQALRREYVKRSEKKISVMQARWKKQYRNVTNTMKKCMKEVEFGLQEQQDIKLSHAMSIEGELKKQQNVFEKQLSGMKIETDRSVAILQADLDECTWHRQRLEEELVSNVSGDAATSHGYADLVAHNIEMEAKLLRTSETIMMLRTEVDQYRSIVDQTEEQHQHEQSQSQVKVCGFEKALVETSREAEKAKYDQLRVLEQVHEETLQKMIESNSCQRGVDILQSHTKTLQTSMKLVSLKQWSSNVTMAKVMKKSRSKHGICLLQRFTTRSISALSSRLYQWASSAKARTARSLAAHHQVVETHLIQKCRAMKLAGCYQMAPRAATAGFYRWLMNMSANKQQEARIETVVDIISEANFSCVFETMSNGGDLSIGAQEDILSETSEAEISPGVTTAGRTYMQWLRGAIR